MFTYDILKFSLHTLTKYTDSLVPFCYGEQSVYIV